MNGSVLQSSCTGRPGCGPRLRKLRLADAGAMQSLDIDMLLSVSSVLIVSPYLAVAFHNSHGDAWKAAIIRAGALVLLLLPILTVYRAILFYFTYLWM